MYYKRTKKRGFGPMLRLIIVIAVIAAAALAIYFLFFSENAALKAKPFSETAVTIPENVEMSSSGMLSLNNGVLSLDSTGGENVWKLNIDAAQDKFTFSDALICTYGEGGAQFFTYDKKQLFSVSLDTPIEEAACGASVAAVLTKAPTDTADNNHYIYVYDTTGANTGKIDLSTMQIIDFGIYGTSDMIWALSLDTSGVVPTSYISTYKGDGTITGSIGINTQIIENVAVTDSQIFASGTNSLTSYSYFGEKQGDELIYGWKPYDISVSGSDIYIEYLPRESEAAGITNVKVIDKELNDIMIYFPSEVFKTFVTQTSIYAVAPYNVYVYNMKGELTKTIDSETPISAAKKISDAYAVIWTGGTSSLMKLS